MSWNFLFHLGEGRAVLYQFHRQISVILHPHEHPLLWSDHVLFPALETQESLGVFLGML